MSKAEISISEMGIGTGVLPVLVGGVSKTAQGRNALMMSMSAGPRRSSCDAQQVIQ
jgi:hypothetical protein